MDYGFFLLFLLLIIVIILSRIEWVNHQRNLKAVALRVVVNGTRGKSTVTRLIGAGLSAGGFKVLSKTTGTKPRIILNNTIEMPVIRPGRPNIMEQLRIIKKAVQERVNAVVIENMSLRPDLQRTEESKIINPDIVVITNVRSDHLDVMGPSLKDIARNFINAVPKRAKVFTAERENFLLLKKFAEERNIEIFQVKEENISDDEMKRFPYLEHRENVALAIEICNHLGIPKKVALKGMYNYIPDPGILRKFELRFNNKNFTLLNALAANDPDSTFLIYERIGSPKENFYLIVNCRNDRIDRSRQLARLVKEKITAKLYFITGGNTKIFYREAIKLGVEREKLIDLGEMSVKDVFSGITERIENDALLLAIGNIVGYGERLIEYFIKTGSPQKI
uniref:Poly-gamma-glutamate synthase PgsB n=1 Tax=candidate division WOR-3 bacterium TaxID=2052148 RepID=A0A7C4XJK8_UNCW3